MGAPDLTTISSADEVPLVREIKEIPEEQHAGLNSGVESFATSPPAVCMCASMRAENVAQNEVFASPDE